MTKKSIFFGLLFLILIVATWWNWTQLNLKPLAKTTLSLSLENKVESLDPAKAYSDDSLTLSAQVLEPLFQYHYLKRPFEIQPLLAEALPHIDLNGRLVRIKIKRGIFYHPHPALEKKQEMVAEDFVTQFKRLALAGTHSPGRSLFVDLIEGFDEYEKNVQGDWKKLNSFSLRGVEASDPFTLTLKLKKSEPNIIYYLAMNFVVPMPWKLVEHYKNNLDEVLIGTGPYVYKGHRDGCHAMIKNVSYRDDFYPTSGDRYANVQKLLASSKEKIPFIGSVKFCFADEVQRWESFLRKDIDILSVPKTYLSQLYDEDGHLTPQLKSLSAELKHFPSLANRWYSFNMRDPVFGKNVNLRKAIAYAIDYTKYIQLISQNTNLRANSLLVPGIAGYLPADEFRFRYDPELAKDYLRKAGYQNSSAIPEIVYSTRGIQPIQVVEARFIKEQLEAIGLRVKIQNLEFADFLQQGRAGKLQFFTDNWFFDYPDGDNIIQLLVSSHAPGVNKSGFSSPRVDTLYAELKQTTHPDQRQKIFHEIEDIVFAELPWIPLMYESSFVLQHKEIKNFRKSSLIRNYVKYLKIEN